MAKKGTVRRYFGRARRRVGRARIPIVPVLAVAGLGASILSDKAGFPRNTIDYVQGAIAGSNSWASPAHTAAKALVNPKNYLVPVGILIIGGVCRMALGRVPLGRRASVF